jgi:hypothetical protein
LQLDPRQDDLKGTPMTTTFADLTTAEHALVTDFLRYTGPMWATSSHGDVEAELWQLHGELGVGADEFADPCASPAAARFWNSEYRRLESAKSAAGAVA